MPQLSKAETALTALLAHTLFGAPMPDIPDDASVLWREANDQAVFLLALRDVPADVFPAPVLQEIRSSVHSFLARNVQIAQAHSDISVLLEKHAIPHVIIKGYASAVWYPDPDLRQMGDVDFYVDRQDVERTEVLLLQEGFTPEKESHSFHHVFAKGGVRYELHFELPGVPEGETGKRCREYFSDLTARSAIRHTPFGDMRLPCAFHHGLILLLHTAHHLTYSGVGLRHLCDWAVFADTMPDGMFADAFSQPLKTLGLWRFACCLTDICVRRLGVRQKSWIDDADGSAGDDLLADLFAGGNFGQKSVVRSRQAYLITSGKKSHSKVRRLFSVLLDMIYQKWPLTKKIKILIPFGWAFYTLRYFARVIRGKRPKLYVRAAVRGAEQRTQLYNKLRLFDCGKEDV